MPRANLQAQIDWNGNGVFGETNVPASILTDAPYLYLKLADTPGALVYDDFSGSGSLGTTPGNLTWQFRGSATWTRFSNNARVVGSAGYNIAYVDTGVSDVSILTGMTPAVGGGSGLALRYVDVSNFLFVDWASSAGNWKVCQVLNGVQTTLATGSMGGVSVGYIRADIEGATIRVYSNQGSNLLGTATITNAAFLGANATGKHGLFMSNGIQTDFDHFTVLTGTDSAMYNTQCPLDLFDDFNSAAGTAIGTSDDGKTWVKLGTSQFTQDGNGGVYCSAMAASGVTGAYYDTGQSDCTVFFNYRAVVGDTIGILLRYTDANNYLYAHIGASVGQIRLSQVVAGVLTNLGDTSGPNFGKFAVSMIGNTVTVHSETTASSSFVTTVPASGKHGLIAFSTATNTTIDEIIVHHNVYADSSGTGLVFTGPTIGAQAQRMTSPITGQGYARRFDGASGLRTPSTASLGLTGDFTFEAWIYVPTYATNHEIFSKYSTTTNFIDCYTNPSGQIEFYQTPSPSGAWIRVTSTNPIPLNGWHHIAITKLGSTVTHYLDGVPNGSGTGTASQSTNAADFAIANRADGGGYMSGAGLSHVAIYTYALDGDRIAAHYESGTSLLEDVSAYLRANPGVTVSRGAHDNVRAYGPPFSSSGTIELDNRLGYFSPERTDSPIRSKIVPGRRVRIRTFDTSAIGFDNFAADQSSDFGDDFAWATGAGTALAAPWTALVGSGTVLGQTGTLGSGSVNGLPVVNLGVGMSEYLYLQVDHVVGSGSATGSGIVFRLIDANNYLAVRLNNAGNISLIKRVDGVETVLNGPVAHGLAGNIGTVAVWVLGLRILVLTNDTVKLNYGLTGGEAVQFAPGVSTTHGLYFGDTATRFDNFHVWKVTPSIFADSGQPWVFSQSSGSVPWFLGRWAGGATMFLENDHTQATIDVGETDFTMSYNLTWGPVLHDNVMGAAWRLTDQTNYMYLQIYSGGLRVHHRVAGNFTQLAAAAHSWSPSTTYAIRVEVAGAVHRVYVDGVLKLTATSDYNYGATRHGFAALAGGTLTYTNLRITAPRQLWTGHLIRPNVLPETGRQVTSMECLGPMGYRLRGKKVSTPLYTNITTDQAIKYLLDAVGWPAADRVNIWTGSGSTYGKTTLLYWYLDEQDAFQALVDLVNTEGPGAAVFEDAYGRIVFQHRHWRITMYRSTNVQQTYRDTGTEPLHSPPLSLVNDASQVINVCTVQTVRRTAAASAKIWEYGSTIILGPSQTLKIAVRPSSGGPFMNAIAPAVTTDYVLDSGSVTSVTIDRTSGGWLTLTIVAGTGGAQISGPGGVGTGIQLRAQLLTVTTRYSLQNQIDTTASQTAYGILPYSLGILQDVDPNVAQDFCDYLVTTYSEPRPKITIAVNNGSTARLTAILETELSDRVAISEEQTGLSLTECYVERIDHTIGRGGTAYQAIISCEKAPITVAYLRLDAGRLDFNRLGF